MYIITAVLGGDRSLAWRGKNKSMLIAIHVMGQNSAYRHNLGVNWEHRTDYGKKSWSKILIPLTATFLQSSEATALSAAGIIICVM